MLLLRGQHLHLVSNIHQAPKINSYILDPQEPNPSDHVQIDNTQSPQAELPLAQQTPPSEPETPSDTDSFATCRSNFSRKSSDPTSPHRRRRNLWKNTKPPRESLTPRPSTPDMSVFVEPLTPPATSPNMVPTRTWSVATHPPIAMQPPYERTDGRHAGLTPTVERPTDQFRSGEQPVPSHVLPDHLRTNSNLPPFPYNGNPPMAPTGPSVAHPPHPETSLSSLIEQSRARTYAQQTQARREQFAVRINHTSDLKIDQPIEMLTRDLCCRDENGSSGEN